MQFHWDLGVTNWKNFRTGAGGSSREVRATLLIPVNSLIWLCSISWVLCLAAPQHIPSCDFPLWSGPSMPTVRAQVQQPHWRWWPWITANLKLSVALAWCCSGFGKHLHSLSCTLMSLTLTGTLLHAQCLFSVQDLHSCWNYLQSGSACPAQASSPTILHLSESRDQPTVPTHHSASGIPALAPHNVGNIKILCHLFGLRFRGSACLRLSMNAGSCLLVEVPGLTGCFSFPRRQTREPGECSLPTALYPAFFRQKETAHLIFPINVKG